MIEELKRFETTFHLRNGHSRRCQVCSRIIKDGERVVAIHTQIERTYPVKGIMKFSRWHFRHVECEQSHQDFLNRTTVEVKQ